MSLSIRSRTPSRPLPSFRARLSTAALAASTTRRPSLVRAAASAVVALEDVVAAVVVAVAASVVAVVAAAAVAEAEAVVVDLVAAAEAAAFRGRRSRSKRDRRTQLHRGLSAHLVWATFGCRFSTAPTSIFWRERDGLLWRHRSALTRMKPRANVPDTWGL